MRKTKSKAAGIIGAFFEYAIETIRYAKADIRLRRAILIADKMHEDSGNESFVIPQSGTSRLYVIDIEEFNTLKNKGYIEDKRTMNDIADECFYRTGERGERMSETERNARTVMWHAYWDVARANEHSAKKKK